ncbi:MAG: lysylphosphatidylglycerol synthase transmembrane domain-containing protein [Gemmatimonadaceae bacterium]
MSRRLQLAFFVCGLALFVFLVARAGPGALLTQLRRTGWAFVPIVLVWAGVYLTNTVAWRLLAVGPEGARGCGIPFWRAYSITVSSFAINYVTPMVSLGGEPFKLEAAAAYVGRRRAAGSVIAFRVVHTLGQLVFWLLTLPVAYALLPRTPATTTLLAATAAALVLAAWLLAALPRSRVLERLLDAIQAVAPLRRLARAVERGRPALAAVDAELAAVAGGHPARLAGALAAEVAGRCVAVLEFVLVARSVGVDMRYGAAAVVGGFSQLVMNLFFFVPFELGPREGSLYLVFRLLGLGAALGVYAAVVSRLRELAWIGIGLALVWAGGGRRA